MTDTAWNNAPAPDDAASTAPNAAIDAATGDDRAVDCWPPLQEEATAAALHRAAAPLTPMPAALAQRIQRALHESGLERERDEREAVAAPLPLPAPRPGRLPWLLAGVAAAAALAGAVSLALLGGRLATRSEDLRTARLRVETLQQTAFDLERRIADNQAQLAQSRAQIETLTQQASSNNAALAQAKREQLDAARRVTELTGQLAQSAAQAARQAQQLDEAMLTIARLEAPADPQIAKQQREKLLEVPDTVRIAWAPFNLEGAPNAEQPGITGDVVWNDRMETGYLRFVGLKVNDPAKEQYQVWVIDERGMEQKVSGGIFNANADGEVIVPIQPGIAVGRVALFAVTIEQPGGTWVPDLKRRVVVAPRPS